MARGVTEQDVFTAADQLLARGERPTIERVRLEIGRGSPNTINPLLDAWWSSLSKRLAGAATDSLPVPIRLATEALYQEVLRQAEVTAGQSVAALRDEVEKDRESVVRAKERVYAESLGAKALAEALKSELAELRAVNDRLTGQVSELTVNLENERSEKARALLTARLSDEERQRTVAAAQAELGRVREQWVGNERHWLKEIEALRDELKHSRQEGKSSTAKYIRRVSALEHEVNDRTAELHAIRDQLASVNIRLSEEHHRRVMAEAAVKAHRNPTNVVKRRLRPLQRIR